jgi:DNA-binding CsgD family transcriptional regulator/tetratricopeptide (TPR) repeat protein
MHAALLTALRASGSADDARAAYHAEGAGDADVVLEVAPRAARRAASLAAHREAAAQFQRALRFAAGRPAAQVAELYDGLATQLSLVDRWQESADARLAALPLWRAAGNRVREGDGLRRLSRALWRLCRGAEADAAAHEALAVLEPLPPGPELAWAYANLAAASMLNSDGEPAIKLARRSAELAERLQQPDVLSDALNTEACAAGNLGRPWDELMRRALQVALDAGLEEQAGRAYANLHAFQNGERLLAEADRTYQEGVAYCDAHDVSTFGTCLRGERTAWLEHVGRWDEAVALCEELLSRTGPSPINRLNPLVSLGKVRARRGDPTAWDALDEAATGSDGTEEPQWISVVRLARAEAAWLAGREDDAAVEVARAAAVAGMCDAWTQAEVSVWQRRLGQPVQPPLAVAGPWALQLEGRDVEAAEAWNALGCRYEAAMARLDSGDEGALRQALRDLDALGATAVATVTRREMRRRGLSSVPAGPRAATREHRFGLTRREQEVLHLVATGLPNADISRRLFISERTVDHHVTAVLAKMGVPSRGVAAREAHRLGLVDIPMPRSSGARREGTAR